MVHAALLVHVEPLVERARVLVLGDDEPSLDRLEESLRDLGARDVVTSEVPPDGIFDLVVVCDLGRFDDPAATIRAVRGAIASGGAVVAIARASTDAGAGARDFPEIAPAALSYGELYDVFARDFHAVSMTGVLPFQGVVFAELGAGEDVSVGVDARLVEPSSPSVFVVVASREPVDLEPYAIVQVPAADSVDRTEALEAALSQALLESKLLAAQLEEQRQRNMRAGATAQQLEDLMEARDAAMNRVVECEAIALSGQQTIAQLERRLSMAEEAILERDDAVAAMKGELDALRSEGEDLASVDLEELAEVLRRAERAEAALALNVADLGHVAEAHAMETATLEEQLRERGEHIAALEKEVGRREQLVRDLVAALEESRELGTDVHRFETAPSPSPADLAETASLRRKNDELALEIAKRDGELVALGWRIEELERAAPAPAEASGPELARAQDEIDALRQALTREHAARMAAESGEELVRARAELARQAALLAQMRPLEQGKGS